MVPGFFGNFFHFFQIELYSVNFKGQSKHDIICLFLLLEHLLKKVQYMAVAYILILQVLLMKLNVCEQTICDLIGF